jgi:hypothetical protein
MLDRYHEFLTRNGHGHVVSGVDWNFLIASRSRSAGDAFRGSSTSVDNGGDGIESSKSQKRKNCE